MPAGAWQRDPRCARPATKRRPLNGAVWRRDTRAATAVARRRTAADDANEMSPSTSYDENKHGKSISNTYQICLDNRLDLPFCECIG